MSIKTDITLRRLIYELSVWSEAHPMLNKFGYGTSLDIFQDSANRYPYMMVDCRTKTSSQWYFKYTIDICIIDWVFDDRGGKEGSDPENQMRVESDTEEIVRDLENTIRWSDRWQQFSKLPADILHTKMVEFGEDKGTGWCGTFVLWVKKTSGICDLKSLMPLYDFENQTPVNPPVCADATYENSDATFTKAIASGATFVSEDINVTINGDDQGDFATNQDLALTFTCPPAAINTSNLYKTGRTTSGRTGDDGDLEEGRGVSWTVLDHLNGFGTTDRFTDELGTQIYANNQLIDWAYEDQVNGTVPMWFTNVFTGVNNNEAIDDALAATDGGYTDWYLANIMELHSISFEEQALNDGRNFDFAPFNHDMVGASSRIWSSTRSSGRAKFYFENGGVTNGTVTGMSSSYFMKRNALLSDLGL